MLFLAGDAVLFAGDTVFINDDPKEPMKMVMVEPWYRQTVYSTLPIKTMKLELYPSVHVHPARLQGSSFVVEVIDANGAVAARAAKSNLPLSSLLIRASVPIESVPYGHYRVFARMSDSSGKPLTDVHGNLCEAQMQLFKAPPAPQEVVFDRSAICRVNGEPFFPIAMYNYSPAIFTLANLWREEKGLSPFTMEEWYLDARKMGVNAVHDGFDWVEPLADVKTRCDLMARAGLRALMGPIEKKVDRSSDFQILARNPGLLGWYTFDEPQQFGEGFIEERVAPKHKRLLAADPYHPQFICDNSPTAVAKVLPYCDVAMPDLYPQRGGDMRVVGKEVAHIKSLSGGRKVVWPVIQAFRLPGYGRKPDGSEYIFDSLTYKEMRAIVFDSVACGATGLSYYAYYTSEGPQTLPDGSKRGYYMLDDYPDQRNAITRINRDLERLIPAVTSGRLLDTSVRPDDSDAHARAFVRDGKCYLLVTNPGRETLDVQIGVIGLPNQTGRDLYSTKSARLEDGRVYLKAQPLDVCVFVFALSGRK